MWYIDPGLLGCLDQPTSGIYRLDGVDVSQVSDDELARVRNKRIGFVFQNYNLLANFTALENVALRHLTIVQPDTVVRWHRAGWRLYWRWRSDPGRGRHDRRPGRGQ